MFSGVTTAFTYSYINGALLDNNFYEDKINFGEFASFNLNRTQLKIPKDYGRLVNITIQNKTTTFWFESSEGFIRNVEIQVSTPVIIKREGILTNKTTLE